MIHYIIPISNRKKRLLTIALSWCYCIQTRWFRLSFIIRWWLLISYLSRYHWQTLLHNVLTIQRHILDIWFIDLLSNVILLLNIVSFWLIIYHLYLSHLFAHKRNFNIRRRWCCSHSILWLDLIRKWRLSNKLIFYILI